ncbi:MAG: CapA family protein [Candidatus Kapaibacterium sp.]|nr:MAG: CapA family protein [Candidatus Kapabacteria bacterium]
MYFLRYFAPKYALQACLYTVFGLFFLWNTAFTQYAASSQNSSSQNTAKSAFGQALRIKAVGDVLLGSYTPSRFIPPDSGNVFVTSIGAQLRGADICFGNFEAAFAIEGKMRAQKCSEASRRRGVCYEFGTPPFLAPSLKKLGFTVMSVDNNHADDYGADAAEFTKQTLREQGIVPAPKRGHAEIMIAGKRVAIAAFGFSETSHKISDVENSARVVRELKKSYERVLVSFHGGAEGKNAMHTSDKTEIFVGENRGNMIQFAHAVIDAGADMVIGHGPHVLRAVELYKNRFIAYSLGNFLTYGNINVKGVSGIACVLEASLDKASGEFLGGRIIPVVQRDPGIPELDPAQQAITLIRELTSSDFPATPLVIEADGTIRRK